MEHVHIVLINENGEVLAVSRKDNHNDFGLPGGKVDPRDLSLKMAATRELEEETGLIATNLELIFAMHRNGKMGYTFVADYSGELFTEEFHVVKWTNFQDVIDGKYGQWNELVYQALRSKNINVKL